MSKDKIGLSDSPVVTTFGKYEKERDCINYIELGINGIAIKLDFDPRFFLDHDDKNFMWTIVQPVIIELRRKLSMS